MYYSRSDAIHAASGARGHEGCRDVEAVLRLVAAMPIGAETGPIPSTVAVLDRSGSWRPGWGQGWGWVRARLLDDAVSVALVTGRLVLCDLISVGFATGS